MAEGRGSSGPSMKTALLSSQCVVCGADGPFRIVPNVRDYVTGVRFRLVQCRRCMYTVTDPIPASLEEYYPQRYRRFNVVAALVLRRLYQRRVDAWLKRLPVTGRALELGSGTGWMLRALAERGWQALGTERTVAGARIAAEAAGVPVYVGDLEALSPAPVLDLIVMFHVLEHLADPLTVLASAASRLRPGGVLILGLPNIASWQSRANGRHWMHLDVPRHLCHFSPQAIRLALAANGLRLTRLDFRSYEHDPLGWTQSTLDKLGFEQCLILKRLIGLREKRGSAGKTIAGLALAVPLTVIGFLLALLSWRAGAGAVMEVWAVREAGT